MDGFYTLVSVVENGEDIYAGLVEEAEAAGVSIEDALNIRFAGESMVVMTIYDFENGDSIVTEGAYTINGDSITLTFIIMGSEQALDGTIEGNKIALDFVGALAVFEKNGNYTGSGAPS